MEDITLTPHELRLCGDLLGVENFPVVLGRGPQSPDLQSWTAALEAARSALSRRGLVDEAGRVADGLEDLLEVLGHPVREIAARRMGDDGVRRLCLASGRRASRVYAARGPGADAAVALGLGVSELAGLRLFLGEHPALALAPANARLRELQEGLAGAEGFADCAHALVRAGIGVTSADLIADVLTTATAHTEIVTIIHSLGKTSATPAAMVVYDAPAGRVVATPHRAPDGRVWVTFTPGSWDRVLRGLRSLDELAAAGDAGGQPILGA